MKGITIKLPDETLAQLRREARAAGCSVAALIRQKLERPAPGQSAYDRIKHLIGSLEGPAISVTNDLPKFGVEKRPGYRRARRRR